jgi:hypothetical protein
MSILESLKEEKKLSLNHWRYRLLHWCFDIKVTPAAPISYELPLCLYTHYCPLFHLTNFIAIFAPLIWLVKIIAGVIGATLHALSNIHWSSVAVSKDSPDIEVLRKAEYKRLFSILTKYHFADFETFWKSRGSEFLVLTKDEIKASYEGLVVKIKDAEAKAELRRKKLRERLLFWTNFSRVFVKWIMNIGYFALVGVMLLAIYWLSWPFLELLKWILEFNPIPMMLFIGKLALLFGLAFIVLYTFFRSRVFSVVGQSCIKAIALTAPPFALVWHTLAAPFRWIAKGWRKTSEFVAIFYEETCPPITIVSEEEELIEETANV